MITRIRLIQGILATFIFFNPAQWCQAEQKAFKIITYDVYLGRGMCEDWASNIPIDVLIKCSGKSDDGRLHGINIIVPSAGNVLPANTATKSPDGKSFYGDIYISRDAYPWFIDLLRNEICIGTINTFNPVCNKIAGSSVAGWGHGDVPTFPQ